MEAMRRSLPLLACALGLATALSGAPAAAESPRGGGTGDHRAEPPRAGVRPDHPDRVRRHPHRRHRHRHRHRVVRTYPYAYAYTRRDFVPEHSASDDAAAERALRERGRVANSAAAEQSWRLWHRPEALYGPPPTTPRNVESLLARERGSDLAGTFCVEGEVVLPDPPTPEARAFCRRGR